MKKPWHPNISSAIAPQSRQQIAKNGFTKAAVRSMAMYDSRKPGANFKCPSCKIYFYLTYGVFGKMTVFEDNTYHCRDCAKKAGFVKS